MNEPTTDLTRWNREGLDRFRYVDGNAATFFAHLRRVLAERFPDWATIAPTDDVLADYLADAGSGDWGSDIARALARAIHVIGEHVDAYANEGFLRTATQWESVRRLVGMIGYQPTPQASAVTPFALTVTAPGMVHAGLAVAHDPPDGAAPVEFETLGNLLVDPAWNTMRTSGWNRSRERISGTNLTLVGSHPTLEVGTAIIVEADGHGHARRVVRTSVDLETRQTEVELDSPIADMPRGYTRVHLSPGQRLFVHDVNPPAQLLDGWISLGVDRHGLEEGSVVAIWGSGRWVAHAVRRIEGPHICLDGIPSSPQRLCRMSRLGIFQALVESTEIRQPQLGTGRKVRGDDHTLGLPVADLSILVPRELGDLSDDLLACYSPEGLVCFRVMGVSESAEEESERQYQLRRVSGPIRRDELGARLAGHPWFACRAAAGDGWPLDPRLDGHRVGRVPRLLVSAAGAVEPGALALLSVGDHCQAAEVIAVEPADDDSKLWVELPALQALLPSDGPVFASEVRLAVDFRHTARLVGWDRNLDMLDGASVLIAGPVPQWRGRRQVVVEDEATRVAIVSWADWKSGTSQLVLSQNFLARAEFTAASTVIHANVVLAGHGARRPERVLGSGNAARSDQVMRLDVPDVSFVADSVFPAGVRADVDVVVDVETWQQVPRLDDCGPTDPVYAVTVTEAGSLDFAFGDGRNGRRLPTGRGNVRVHYRAGAGLTGNLPAGSLTRLVSAHPLVEAVLQPLPAAGGNEREDIASMRQNAPRSVLTMGRAVSLADFEALAMQHASVWQARARRATRGGRRFETIEVAVVPAGGAELTATLRDALRARLEQVSEPGIRISVERCVLQPAAVEVTIGSDTQRFDPKTLEAALRQGLLTHFSLERRRIETPLFAADIHEFTHRTPGVVHVDVKLGGRRQPRLPAEEKTVLYIDHQSLTVVVQEASR